MKKIYTLLMAAALAIPSLRAQDPEIYYSLGSMTGASIPTDGSTALTSTAEGVYTCVISGWQKGNWAAQYVKFYSISNDVMTVYGQKDKTNAVGLNLSSTPISYELGTVEVPAADGVYKNSGSSGFYVSASTENQTNVQVTINLLESTITFDIASDAPAVEIPTLENVSPEIGSTLTPNASDGSVTITVTFSGEVKSLEALVDGTLINTPSREVWNGSAYDEEPTGWDNNVTSSNNGTVWTLVVPAELVAQGATEDGGSLILTLSKVFDANNLQVTFGDNGSKELKLNYLVSGVSKTSTLNITGNENDVLTVYESIAIEDEDVQYLNGVGTVSISGNESYEFPISTVHRFLFTVPAGYTVTVTPSETLESGTSTYTTGTMFVQRKYVDEEADDDNAEVIYYNVMEGVSLNAYDGAIGKTFNVTVSGSAASAPAMSSDSSFTLKPGSDEEEQNQYIGYSDIEEGALSFNFVYGNQYLVPANLKNTAIVFNEFNSFSAPFTVATSSEYANVNWTYAGWEGGEFGVMFDFDTYTVSFNYTADESDEDVWYISGDFNEFYPWEDTEKWSLTVMAEENGVYSGTFTADKGMLSFNLMNASGTVLTPDEGETVVMAFEATEEDNVTEYNGYVYPAADEEEYTLYWTYPDWAGGEFTVTLDLNESTIKVSANSSSTGVKAIGKVKADDVIYNLQGIKVANPVKGQIYILNGKKVVL